MGQSPPVFCSCLLWPNGCMYQDNTWYGGRPQPRQHCVRRGLSSPAKGTQQSPLFGLFLLWPQSPISATADLVLVSAVDFKSEANMLAVIYFALLSSSLLMFLFISNWCTLLHHFFQDTKVWRTINACAKILENHLICCSSIFATLAVSSSSFSTTTKWLFLYIDWW